LENFDLKQYFINSGYLVDWSEKEAASYVKTLTKKSILKQKEKDLKEYVLHHYDNWKKDPAQ
jgi:hypothetical protein